MNAIWLRERAARNPLHGFLPHNLPLTTALYVRTAAITATEVRIGARPAIYAVPWAGSAERPTPYLVVPIPATNNVRSIPAEHRVVSSVSIDHVIVIATVDRIQTSLTV